MSKTIVLLKTAIGHCRMALLMVFFLHKVAAWAVTQFYDAEQLSSNLITSLCQDRQGYIWIGTEYGLNKFDGIHFTQYYNDDSNPRSLSDDVIRCMLTDRDGVLWVVCNRAVQRYDRSTDGFETVAFEGWPTANVNDILQTPDGHIWLLTAASGVFEVDTDSLKALPVATINKHVDTKDKANNMYLDHQGRLWISYQGTGLQMIDLKAGKSHYYEDQLLPDNRAVDMLEDDRQRFTVLTYTDVLQLNEQTQQLESVASYPRNAVHRLYKNSTGELFVGTTGSGLWRVDPLQRGVTPVTVGSKASFQTSKVHAMLEDRNGNLWVGCFQRGLFFTSRKPSSFRFMSLSQMEHNNGNVLRSVFADSHHRVYVCQEKGGITEIDHEGHALHHWMGDRTVMTVSQRPDGKLWAGTYRNGLFIVDPETGREEAMPLTAKQRINGLAYDRQGNLYTAVFFDGLRSYTPDGRTERTLGKGNLELHNRYPNTLFTDRSGRIWIGHYYGIDVYDPATDRMVDVGVPETLRPAIVYAIGQSPDGCVWVGSDKGLFRFSSAGQWKRFTTHEGLPNNIISSFVMAKDGTVWVSTYRGLAQIEPDGRITSYYRGNGLQEWSYVRGISAHSTSGEVIFGNQNGITYFVPEKIVKDDFANGITLTAMRLGDVDVNTTTLSDGKPVITTALDEADRITVSYHDNTFSLRFSPMDYRDAQNVHYEFRFADETADQWYQTESGRSEIYFSHLAAGTHRLIVRACDNGVYSPEKIITIQVTPPWYRSWGAYVFYLLVVIGIVALWWRNYWNRRQAETNEEKIKFFVDISHELRSPLTLIKSPLDQLLRTSHDPVQTRALRNIERNTSRLLTLTNQILSIRKIEKGQMQLHFAETRLGDFVGDICHDYDYQAEKRQLHLSFNNQAGDLSVWIDRDNFDKVVTNLIGNAMKYVPDGGKIDVIVRPTGYAHVELVVRDDGPGIDEAQLRKVFDRFYQTSARPAVGQMSYGIGLNLTQKIVTLHRGTVTARNRTDSHGSEFIVRLPLGSNHLPQEQLVDSDYYAASAAQEERQVLATDADRPRRVRKKTTFHVAVVDDDEEIRRFLQTELGESYHVHTYPDGQKALEGIVDSVPDLVISDVMMPVMNGFDLLHRIKNNTKTSHIPVILLTTKTEHESRVEGLEQGADAYIDKPFNLEELEARMAGLIANRQRMRGKFSGTQEQEDVVRKVELKGNDQQLMERIMKTVNERLSDEDFNVEALADEVGLSRVQLHRRMKEITGITVGEFIRNLRLQQAARLLEKGDITVAQVTYAVGFANPTHFSAAFKKHFGVTPSEYITKHQSKKDL